MLDSSVRDTVSYSVQYSVGERTLGDSIAYVMHKQADITGDLDSVYIQYCI